MKKQFILLCVVLTACTSLFSSCKKQEEEPNFGEAKVSLQKLSTDNFSKMRILFTPSENAVKTVFAIGTEADRETFKQGIIEGLTEQEGNEPFEYIFENLDQNEDYTVFAVAYDETGFAGSIASLKSTPKLGEVNLELQYKTDISAGFKYTCAATIASCRYYLGTEADRDAFIANTVECGVLADIYENFTFHYYDLQPDTDYILYAMAEDIAGLQTEVVEIPFRTESSESNMPNLAKGIEIISQDAYTTTVKLTPNDACGKIVCSFTPAGEYDWNIQQYKGNILEMFEFKGGTGELKSSKDGSELTLEYSDANLNLFDTDFDIYVMFSDNDYNPVSVRKYIVEGYAFDENAGTAKCENVENTSLTSSSATFTITLNDDAAGAYYNSIDKEFFDQQTAASQGDLMWIAEFLVNDIKGNMVYGKKRFEFEDTAIDAGQSFYLSVCPFNKNGNRGWGEFYTEEFTAPSF